MWIVKHDAVLAPPASYEPATAQPITLSVYHWPVGSKILYRVVRWVLIFFSFVGVIEFFRSIPFMVKGGINWRYLYLRNKFFANSKGGLMIEGRNFEWVWYIELLHPYFQTVDCHESLGLSHALQVPQLSSHFHSYYSKKNRMHLLIASKCRPFWFHVLILKESNSNFQKKPGI